jgi:F-type H+-transporting ATPase subunit gamma
MPSLIDIRRRLRSVRNTQQITKAMKMVSAAKLRRAQDQAIAARPYSRMLQRVLENVAQAAAQDLDPADQPLLAVRPERRILAVVITADSGLAGAFNANLIRLAQRFADEHGDADLSFLAVGKKGRDYLRRKGRRIAGERVDVFRRLRFEDAAGIASMVMEKFSAAEADSVYVLSNEFKTVMAPRLSQQKLLPIELPQGGRPADYIYEQPPAELLGALLPRYIQLQIYKALLESSAAEHAARMTAMEAATKNAGDMIDRITLNMNRIRQATITREIIEIVSGAAALE